MGTFAMQKGRNLVYGLANKVTVFGGKEFDKFGHGTVGILAFFLGIAFGGGVWLFLLSESWADFGAYMFCISFFHWSEYIMVAMHRNQSLSSNAFLINHSMEYTIAFVACGLEYLIGRYFFPSLKNNWFIYIPGVLLAIFGLTFRVLAQHHAKQAFTHDIKETKRDVHKLVTVGAYSIVRHPGYFGWFWYTVGTQIILANPICLPAFAFASFVFFRDRIAYEEKKLIEFFGDDYVKFRAKTPTYI